MMECKHIFISIHVPRMGDDEEVSSQIDDLAISIHVPRMGDDHWGSSFAQNGMSISIHVPRMGDDGKYPKTKVI